MPLSLIENPWLRHFVLWQYGKVRFRFCKTFVQEHIPNMLVKVMEWYLLPNLAQCVIVTTFFDLWMFKTKFDTFALVINFINDNWLLCHITIKLLKTSNISKVTLAKQVKSLLVEYQFINNIITYVKNKGTNLNILATILILIVFCEPLQLVSPFNGTCLAMWCWKHVSMPQMIIRFRDWLKLNKKWNYEKTSHG